MTGSMDSRHARGREQDSACPMSLMSEGDERFTSQSTTDCQLDRHKHMSEAASQLCCRSANLKPTLSASPGCRCLGTERQREELHELLSEEILQGQA